MFPLTITECLPRLLQSSEMVYRLSPAAPEAALRQLEQAVAEPLPGQLRELYQISNGIGEYLVAGSLVELTGHLVLPAEAAAAENRQVRGNPRHPMEASLLIFAPTYIGGWFGFRVAELPAAAPAVYCWAPSEDELTLVANSLPEFLLGWADGLIRI